MLCNWIEFKQVVCAMSAHFTLYKSYWSWMYEWQILPEIVKFPFNGKMLFKTDFMYSINAKEIIGVLLDQLGLLFKILALKQNHGRAKIENFKFVLVSSWEKKNKFWKRYSLQLVRLTMPLLNYNNNDTLRYLQVSMC